MNQSPRSAPHPDGLSMLEKRTIEAEILKEVYETLKASHGEAVAKKTIEESVRRSAIEQARQFAAATPGGTSLKAFQDVMPLWTKGGALEIEVKEQGDSSFTFNVVRCRYAETYKAMGLGELYRWKESRDVPDTIKRASPAAKVDAGGPKRSTSRSKRRLAKPLAAKWRPTVKNSVAL